MGRSGAAAQVFGQKMTVAVPGEHREMDGFQRIQKENRNHFVTDGMWKENKVSRMTSTFLA